MATYYVYSPHSGQLIASDCYCYRRVSPCASNGCNSGNYCKDSTNCVSCGGSCFCNTCCRHVIVGGGIGNCCPLDISAASGSLIYAYMSRNIYSVKLLLYTGVCNRYTGDINNGVTVELYTGFNATGTKLGSVLFAHVSNITSNIGNVINITQFGNPWSVFIGTVPSVPGGQSCYLSTHTHFSAQAQSGASLGRTGLGCGSNVGAASTAIYWWNY
jgi:hypothetical protein